MGLGLILDNEADGGFFECVTVARVVIVGELDERMGNVETEGLDGGVAGDAGQRELHLDVEVVVEELVGGRGGFVVFEEGGKGAS